MKTKNWEIYLPKDQVVCYRTTSNELDLSTNKIIKRFFLEFNELVV